MPVYHKIQNQENLMTQTQDIRQKPIFGPKLSLNGPNLGPKNFFQPLFHFHQLDTMPVYHNIQNQENLMTQTQKSDQKPQIWANLGLICSNLGQKDFFSKIGLRHFF